jgi:GH15 family glucan-1,4-alpha-glucosidase
MIWAAFACGVEAVEKYGLDGPVERWRELRDTIRHEIETQGFDPERNSFRQHYGTSEVDASLLLLSQIGFVEADDPRMLGTVAAIEEDLLRDGLLLRYRTESGVDGLPGGEHPFLACSFWLVQQYANSGRLEDAIDLMDRLVGLSNDVGLLSEEYDVHGRRQVGNTPQAFSHLALVRSADTIARASAARGHDVRQAGRHRPGR